MAAIFKPPHSKTIHLFTSKDQLIICTGSNAWDRAKPDNPAKWQIKVPKLVLPFGDDPKKYRWPVFGRYCQVWTFGEPEPHNRLIELVIELFRFGATKALLLSTQKPGVLIEPKTRNQAAA